MRAIAGAFTTSCMDLMFSDRAATLTETPELTGLTVVSNMINHLDLDPVLSHGARLESVNTILSLWPIILLVLDTVRTGVERPIGIDYKKISLALSAPPLAGLAMKNATNRSSNSVVGNEWTPSRKIGHIPLPMAKNWTFVRDVPAPPGQSFRSWWEDEHEKKSGKSEGEKR